MFRHFRFAAGLLALLTLPASAQEVTLRLHQFLPQDSFVPAQILTPWAEAVEAASDGRIKVQQFPAMALGGKPSDLVDQAVDGIADVVWTLPGYTPGRFPHTEVVELPFMSRDAGATSRALWQMAEGWADSDFKDLHLLGIWVHGPGVIHSARPVEGLADMQGLNLRAPSRAASMLLEGAGAAPIGMPAPAIPEALSKRVIDGAMLPWEVTSSIRVGDFVDNHTEFDGPAIYTAVLMLAMNKDRYEALPDDLKAVIDAASGLAFSEQAGRVQQGADAAMREAALQAGDKLVVIGADAAQDWHALGAEVVSDWAEAQAFDGAALVDQARDTIAAAEADLGLGAAQDAGASSSD